MHSSAGYCYVQVYDRTNSVPLGTSFGSVSPTYPSNSAATGQYPCIIAPTTDIDIDIRITTTSANITCFEYTNTAVLIEEYGGY